MLTSVAADRRVSPQDLEAERTVIGGVLVHAAALLDVLPLVTASDFYHPAHDAIFQAFVDLDAAKQPIDTLTVGARMRAAGTDHKLRAYNGEGYFAELMSAVVTVENIAHHARTVRGHAAARRLIDLAQEIAAAGYGGEPIDELRARAERGVLGLEVDIGDAGPQAAVVTMRTLADRIEARRGANGISGVATGFTAVESILGGLGMRRTTVIGARPKMGKTSFVAQVLEHAAVDQRIPSLGITLEVSRNDLLDGMAARRANVATTSLQTGYFTEGESRRLPGAQSDIATAPLWVTDQARTLAAIRSTVRRWRMREGAGPKALVTVDYLQRVKHSLRGSTRDREVTEISDGLCSLAVEADVAMLVVASLNRECDKRPDKRPEPSDLRDSGSIESDADAVLFLYRDWIYHPENDETAAEVIVRYNRFGPTGMAKLRWTARTTRFDNLAADEPRHWGNGT